MGRATSGVIGMRFSDGDELLGMHVVADGADVLVATDGGYAKRTPADQYPVQGRGGLGVVTARIVEARGELVGALMVQPGGRGLRDHLGGRRDQDARRRRSSSPAGRPWASGWSTWRGQSLVAIARNAEWLDEANGAGGAGRCRGR